MHDKERAESLPAVPKGLRNSDKGRNQSQEIGGGAFFKS